MQTTVSIERSSEGEAAANAREAGGNGAAAADAAAASRTSCMESATIDMDGPGSAMESETICKKGYARVIANFRSISALPERFRATVNGKELTKVKAWARAATCRQRLNGHAQTAF